LNLRERDKLTGESRTNPVGLAATRVVRARALKSKVQCINMVVRVIGSRRKKFVAEAGRRRNISAQADDREWSLRWGERVVSTSWANARQTHVLISSKCKTHEVTEPRVDRMLSCSAPRISWTRGGWDRSWSYFEAVEKRNCYP
jgi:hypothetical protein